MLTFVVVYLLLNVGIGFWASRRVRNTADFVVAGQHLPLFLAASAMFATWFGAETVLGASADFAQEGLLGIIEDPLGAALCLFLAGVLVARPLYRKGYYTFCDFFRVRFGPRAELLSALLMIPSYFGWIAAQLLAMATVLTAIAPAYFPPEAGMGAPILLCAAAVLAYTFTGGMWAVSVTDAFQSVVIVLGLFAICGVMLYRAGGISPLFQTAVAEQPDFFRFWPEHSALGYLGYLAAWITIGLGSIPQQDVFQRIMAAKSEKTAERAAYLSGLMYLTVAMLPLLVMLGAKHLYPGLIPDAEKAGEDELATAWQLTLPRMVLAQMPPLLQGLFFGALLSAIMSTTSGALLAPATVLGENVVRQFWPGISDRRLLWSIRVGLVGIAAATVVMASYSHDISDLVAESSAFSLVSLFVPLMAGLYWKHATADGAMASMLLGLVAWWLFGRIAPPEIALIWGTLASALGLFAVSWADKRFSNPHSP
jgi:SSS family solute:Na+ symporter